jgi:hypothetical protein
MIQPPIGDGSGTRRPEPGAAGNQERHVGADGVEVTEAVEAVLRYFDDPATALEVPDDAPEAVRVLLQAVAAARHDDAALEHLYTGEPPVELPPLSDDPLAVALGLAPRQHTTVSGAALKAARLRANVKISQLAQKLTEAGHEVRTGQLQRWEVAASVPVDPELLTDLAGILRVDESRLLANTDAAGDLALTPRFRDLAKRWAALSGLTITAAQRFLLTKAALPARRGTAFDNDTALAALNAFVEEHERRGSKDR